MQKIIYECIIKVQDCHNFLGKVRWETSLFFLYWLDSNYSLMTAQCEPSFPYYKIEKMLLRCPRRNSVVCIVYGQSDLLKSWNGDILFVRLPLYFHSIIQKNISILTHRNGSFQLVQIINFIKWGVLHFRNFQKSNCGAAKKFDRISSSSMNTVITFPY